MSLLAHEIILLAKVPSLEKLVLQAIEFHGRNGGTYPSVRTIALIAGISTSTAQAALHSLKDKGLLSWVAGHGRAVSTYTIHYEKLSPLDFRSVSPGDTKQLRSVAASDTQDAPLCGGSDSVLCRSEGRSVSVLCRQPDTNPEPMNPRTPNPRAYRAGLSRIERIFSQPANVAPAPAETALPSERDHTSTHCARRGVSSAQRWAWFDEQMADKGFAVYAGRVCRSDIDFTIACGVGRPEPAYPTPINRPPINRPRIDSGLCAASAQVTVGVDSTPFGGIRELRS